jgi:hypothetical protein
MSLSNCSKQPTVQIHRQAERDVCPDISAETENWRKHREEEKIMKGRKVMFRCSCLFALFSIVSALLLPAFAVAQDYPVMNMVADKVIQKYQNSSCEQLWQKKGKPKPAMEQKVIQLLKSDPAMRQAFIDKVAPPIANKMFECGMIP